MSSVFIAQIDKERFLYQIELAVHAKWISQQQADDLKHIFGDRGGFSEGVDDVTWDNVLSIVLDRHLQLIRRHNMDIQFLKYIILPELKTQIQNSLNTVGYLKSLWRDVYSRYRSATQVSNYYGAGDDSYGSDTPSESSDGDASFT